MTPPSAAAEEASSTNAPTPNVESTEVKGGSTASSQEQKWNWHAQNTDILQYNPRFSAKYSGPNSLNNANEVRETVSLDLLVGARLWRGAEAHVDGMLWQGFGLSRTLGVEGFPNGEAFRLGAADPNVTFARVFIRQTIGLGGEQETVEDDALHLAGKEDISRVTITVGKMSAKDIFDNNAYANDPRTQFMNWGLMANEGWDYPADSLGYETGLAAELNQPDWSLRYGFFQVPERQNGMAQDFNYLKAWSMVAEAERRYKIAGHPGAIRFLGFLTEANMVDLRAALSNPNLDTGIEEARAYRQKYGFGLNMEQEIVTNVGCFMRLGWNDGKTEGWVFSDVNKTVSLGASLRGALWNRPNDTLGAAGVLNGLSRDQRDFFAAGGLGILGGDGKINYALEQVAEVYYDIDIWKTVHMSLDYQFVKNPACNRDRGPVSFLGVRLHWEL